MGTFSRNVGPLPFRHLSHPVLHGTSEHALSERRQGKDNPAAVVRPAGAGNPAAFGLRRSVLQGDDAAVRRAFAPPAGRQVAAVDETIRIAAECINLRVRIFCTISWVLKYTVASCK